jgi:thioredoxin 1
MPAYDSPINANDQSFEQAVLQAGLPVVAVFWAPQAVPRQRLGDVLGELARVYAGEALVVKLEAADAPQAQERYEVNTLPQFLFFRQGELVARARGMPTAEMLRPWVEFLLGRGPRPVARRREAAEAGDDRPLVVTDDDFERVVLGARVPVLVDCWAAWCGPCRTIAPIVEDLAREFAGRALVTKLDVDDNPLTAMDYSVRSIPTLLYFAGGREVDRAVGAQPAHVLRAKLAALV